MRKPARLTAHLTALTAFIFVACSSGGGGRPIYTPTGDMAVDNTGTPDMAMKQPLPDFSMNDVPPDFSMTQQPPDMSMVKMYMYGCNGLVGCTNPCPDNACYMACLQQASPASNKLFQNMITCVFVQACPAKNGGGGICDTTAMNYNKTNCDNCITASQAMGGQCYAALTNCSNDKP